MFNFIFKISAELVGIQIIGTIFSAVFYFPHILYSIFTAFLFLWALHSTFWQLGNKERKKVIILNNHIADEEKKIKLNCFKGAYLSLPFFIINLIITFITYILQSDLLIEIRSLLNLPFIEFLNKPPKTLDYNYLISRLIIDLVMYLTCVIGYISGTKNISIIEKVFPKIIYKQNKKDK